jgi:outer membrane PBP1 activator LpoA protein
MRINSAGSTMPRLAARVLLALMLLALSGCATGPASGPATALADSLYAEGNFRAAAAEYQRLASSAWGAARDPLLLRAGESLREEGDLDGAAVAIAKVRRAKLEGDGPLRFDLLSAEIALHQGDAERALSLAMVDTTRVSRAQAAPAAETRARALDSLGRPLDAAAERVALLELAPADRATIEEDLLRALIEVPSSDLNRALAEMARGDGRRPWVERALRAQGEVAARVVGRGSRAVGAKSDDDPDARIWGREGGIGDDRVALLLPLSGDLAQAGNAIRDGFLAAYFDDLERRPAVRIYDVGPGPEAAIAAYARAVADGNRRVVGPLGRDQVQAVLRQAELPIPVLALNHPDDGAPPPPGSQLFGLLPEEEAAFVAEQALASGARRAAMLASTEDWGLRAAQAFRAQFVQGGGVVAGEARIAANSIDVASAVDEATKAGADTVFLALRPQQARVAAPLLVLRDAARPVYATSHVYGGQPAPTLDRDLNGLVFCDAPWLFNLNLGFVARADLADSLPGAAQNPRLFAFGMDAYRLLAYVDWLGRNTDDYLPGASGDLSVDEFGRVRRSLACLRFVEGVPQAIDGALSLTP